LGLPLQKKERVGAGRSNPGGDFVKIEIINKMPQIYDLFTRKTS
jgi:hypothetical protein